MTRSKLDSRKRVIVDLSWTVNASVDSFVPLEYFNCFKFKLKYLSIDYLVNKVKVLGC